MAEESQPKWEGKVSVKIASLTVKQVWSCLEDFCNIHKWFPNLDTCYLVEGAPGQPGLVRYCATTNASLPQDQSTDEKTTTQWAKEKLLMIDPVQRCFSYEVTDNNIGFKSYEATIKVLPTNGADEDRKGCMVEWSFVSDPIEGRRFKDLDSYIDYCLQHMAKKMEQAILSNE